MFVSLGPDHRVFFLIERIVRSDTVGVELYSKSDETGFLACRSLNSMEM